MAAAAARGAADPTGTEAVAAAARVGASHACEEVEVGKNEALETEWSSPLASGFSAGAAVLPAACVLTVYAYTAELRRLLYGSASSRTVSSTTPAAAVSRVTSSSSSRQQLQHQQQLCSEDQSSNQQADGHVQLHPEEQQQKSHRSVSGQQHESGLTGESCSRAAAANPSALVAQKSSKNMLHCSCVVVLNRRTLYHVDGTARTHAVAGRSSNSSSCSVSPQKLLWKSSASAAAAAGCPATPPAWTNSSPAPAAAAGGYYAAGSPRSSAASASSPYPAATAAWPGVSDPPAAGSPAAADPPAAAAAGEELPQCAQPPEAAPRPTDVGPAGAPSCSGRLLSRSLPPRAMPRPSATYPAIPAAPLSPLGVIMQQLDCLCPAALLLLASRVKQRLPAALYAALHPPDASCVLQQQPQQPLQLPPHSDQQQQPQQQQPQQQPHHHCKPERGHHQYPRLQHCYKQQQPTPQQHEQQQQHYYAYQHQHHVSQQQPFEQHEQQQHYYNPRQQHDQQPSHYFTQEQRTRRQPWQSQREQQEYAISEPLQQQPRVPQDEHQPAEDCTFAPLVDTQPRHSELHPQRPPRQQQQQQQQRQQFPLPTDPRESRAAESAAPAISSVPRLEGSFQQPIQATSYHRQKVSSFPAGAGGSAAADGPHTHGDGHGTLRKQLCVTSPTAVPPAPEAPATAAVATTVTETATAATVAGAGDVEDAAGTGEDLDDALQQLEQQLHTMQLRTNLQALSTSLLRPPPPTGWPGAAPSTVLQEGQREQSSQQLLLQQQRRDFLRGQQQLLQQQVQHQQQQQGCQQQGRHAHCQQVARQHEQQLHEQQGRQPVQHEEEQQQRQPGVHEAQAWQQEARSLQQQGQQYRREHRPHTPQLSEEQERGGGESQRDGFQLLQRQQQPLLREERQHAVQPERGTRGKDQQLSLQQPKEHAQPSQQQLLLDGVKCVCHKSRAPDDEEAMDMRRLAAAGSQLPDCPLQHCSKSCSVPGAQGQPSADDNFATGAATSLESWRSSDASNRQSRAVSVSTAPADEHVKLQLQQQQRDQQQPQVDQGRQMRLPQLQNEQHWQPQQHQHQQQQHEPQQQLLRFGQQQHVRPHMQQRPRGDEDNTGADSHPVVRREDLKRTDVDAEEELQMMKMLGLPVSFRSSSARKTTVPAVTASAAACHYAPKEGDGRTTSVFRNCGNAAGAAGLLPPPPHTRPQQQQQQYHPRQQKHGHPSQSVRQLQQLPHRQQQQRVPEQHVRAAQGQTMTNDSGGNNEGREAGGAAEEASSFTKAAFRVSRCEAAAGATCSWNGCRAGGVIPLEGEQLRHRAGPGTALWSSSKRNDASWRSFCGNGSCCPEFRCSTNTSTTTSCACGTVADAMARYQRHLMEEQQETQLSLAAASSNSGTNSTHPHTPRFTGSDGSAVQPCSSSRSPQLSPSGSNGNSGSSRRPRDSSLAAAGTGGRGEAAEITNEAVGEGGGGAVAAAVAEQGERGSSSMSARELTCVDDPAEIARVLPVSIYATPGHYDAIGNSTESSYYRMPTMRFQRYAEGVLLDDAGWFETTEESIARYTAKVLRKVATYAAVGAQQMTRHAAPRSSRDSAPAVVRACRRTESRSSSNGRVSDSGEASGGRVPRPRSSTYSNRAGKDSSDRPASATSIRASSFCNGSDGLLLQDGSSTLASAERSRGRLRSCGSCDSACPQKEEDSGEGRRSSSKRKQEVSDTAAAGGDTLDNGERRNLRTGLQEEAPEGGHPAAAAVTGTASTPAADTSGTSQQQQELQQSGSSAKHTQVTERQTEDSSASSNGAANQVHKRKASSQLHSSAIGHVQRPTAMPHALLSPSVSFLTPRAGSPSASSSCQRAASAPVSSAAASAAAAAADSDVPSAAAATLCRCAPAPLIVMDCCCGVGGNVIQFAYYFDACIGVDCDFLKIALCGHNSSIYNVRDKVYLYLDTLQQWLQKRQAARQALRERQRNETGAAAVSPLTSTAAETGAAPTGSSTPRSANAKVEAEGGACSAAEAAEAGGTQVMAAAAEAPRAEVSDSRVVCRQAGKTATQEETEEQKQQEKQGKRQKRRRQQERQQLEQRQQAQKEKKQLEKQNEKEQGTQTEGMAGDSIAGPHSRAARRDRGPCGAGLADEEGRSRSGRKDAHGECGCLRRPGPRERNVSCWCCNEFTSVVCWECRLRESKREGGEAVAAARSAAQGGATACLCGAVAGTAPSTVAAGGALAKVGRKPAPAEAEQQHPATGAARFFPPQEAGGLAGEATVEGAAVTETADGAGKKSQVTVRTVAGAAFPTTAAAADDVTAGTTTALKGGSSGQNSGVELQRRPTQEEMLTADIAWAFMSPPWGGPAYIGRRSPEEKLYSIAAPDPPNPRAASAASAATPTAAAEPPAAAPAARRAGKLEAAAAVAETERAGEREGAQRIPAEGAAVPHAGTTPRAARTVPVADAFTKRGGGAAAATGADGTGAAGGGKPPTAEDGRSAIAGGGGHGTPAFDDGSSTETGKSSSPATDAAAAAEDFLDLPSSIPSVVKTAARISRNICLFLPRSTNVHELAVLAAALGFPLLEVESLCVRSRTPPAAAPAHARQQQDQSMYNRRAAAAFLGPLYRKALLVYLVRDVGPWLAVRGFPSHADILENASPCASSGRSTPPVETAGAAATGPSCSTAKESVTTEFESADLTNQNVVFPRPGSSRLPAYSCWELQPPLQMLGQHEDLPDIGAAEFHACEMEKRGTTNGRRFEPVEQRAEKDKMFTTELEQQLQTRAAPCVRGEENVEAAAAAKAVEDLWEVVLTALEKMLLRDPHILDGEARTAKESIPPQAVMQDRTASTLREYCCGGEMVAAAAQTTTTPGGNNGVGARTAGGAEDAVAVNTEATAAGAAAGRTAAKAVETGTAADRRGIDKERGAEGEAAWKAFGDLLTAKGLRQHPGRNNEEGEQGRRRVHSVTVTASRKTGEIRAKSPQDESKHERHWKRQDVMDMLRRNVLSLEQVLAAAARAEEEKWSGVIPS